MIPGPVEPQRYTYLDLLRGFAAIAVMLVHYRFIDAPVPGQGLADYHGYPGASVLFPFYRYGGNAVQLFWLLSGVVFVLVYGEQGRAVDVKRFAVWRFARLYPLHVATLFLVLAVQWASLRLIGRYEFYDHNDAYHFMLNLLFAPAWGFERGQSFNAPIWSVSVEVLIYAVFVIYLKFARPGVATLAAISAGFMLLTRLVHSEILNCGALFFYGACIAQPISLWRRRPALAVALALLGFALTIGVAVSRAGAAYHEYAIYLFALPSILLIALTLDLHLPPVPRRLRWIGDLTYAVYLLHMPVLMIIGIAGSRLHAKLGARPEVLAAYLLSAIGLAAVTHHAFERPAQVRIRRAWLAREPRERR